MSLISRRQSSRYYTVQLCHMLLNIVLASWFLLCVVSLRVNMRKRVKINYFSQLFFSMRSFIKWWKATVYFYSDSYLFWLLLICSCVWLLPKGYYSSCMSWNSRLNWTCSTYSKEQFTALTEFDTDTINCNIVLDY